MNAPSLQRAHPNLAPRSARGRLARLAADAVASTAGAVRLAAGDPLARTWDGDGWINGVAIVAEPDGRYALTLHLVADLVVFERLSRALKETLVASAADQGIVELLGPIRIVIEDVEGPVLEGGDRGEAR